VRGIRWVSVPSDVRRPVLLARRRRVRRGIALAVVAAAALLSALNAGGAPVAARGASQACTLDDRFLGFGESEAALVGSCATGVTATRDGKTAWQGTSTGVLLWQQHRHRVYFFTRTEASRLADGRFELLYDPGRR
jgi:hypothetical protein